MAAKNSQRWTKNIHAQLSQECKGIGHQGNPVCCFPAEIGVGEGKLEEPPVTLRELCHQRLRTPSLSSMCCGLQVIDTQ